MKTTRVAERAFKILKGNGYQIRAYDVYGQETSIPEDATRFFINEPNLMVTITDDEIKISKNSDVSHNDIQSMTKSMKNLANESLRNYTIKDYGKHLQPKHFAYQTEDRVSAMTEEKEKIQEARLSKLFGYMKTSYQTLGEVKITYRHRVPVNEQSPVSRIRNVKSITLEHNGVKYDFPTICIPGARAMARHLHEGGIFDDNVGLYICESSKNLVRLIEFKRYASKNKNLIEGNETALELVLEKIQQLRYDFKKMVSPRTYPEYRDKFSEDMNMDNSTDVDGIRDQFTVKSFNDKFESVLPLISNLLQEKENFENGIREAIDDGVFMTKAPYYSPVVEFDQPNSKLAYKLKETSLVLENESLSNFLSRVSEKISTQQQLEEFEIKMVKDILERASVKAVNNVSGDAIDNILESYSKKLDKYVDIKNIYRNK